MINRKCLFPILIVCLLIFSCKKQKAETVFPLIDKNAIENYFNKGSNGVLFNHFYVVLDSSSFSKFQSNTYLKKHYAGLDRGMPNFEPIHDTATSIYLRGERHYIEILGPNNKFNEPVGKFGIGFSLYGKSPNFLNNSPKLKKEGTKFLNGIDTVSVTVNKKDLVWYKPYYTYGMETNLHTWYSYYNPDFLNVMNGDIRETYTAEEFLKHAYKAEKLFHGIKTIIINCNKADHFRIASELDLLGCPIVSKKSDDLIFKVGDVYIKLIKKANILKSSIVQFEVILNREDNRVLELDNIKIENEGKKSRWTFYRNQ